MWFRHEKHVKKEKKVGEERKLENFKAVAHMIHSPSLVFLFDDSQHMAVLKLK